MAYPANYKYTKEHEWIALENSTAANIGSIGITDYAQNSLGDIVFVELPKVGDTLEAGKTFGSIESVKSVSDLFAPVTGTVTAINEHLTNAPETINAEANTTWIVKIELSEPTQVDALLSAADYEAFITEETGH
jgi:glycine cleavage system H protein